MKEKSMPLEASARRRMPNASLPERPAPATLDAERTVTIEGKPYEIKPTKTKYFRSQWANGHVLLKHYTLSEIYALTQERDGIDGDSAIYKFLVAVFDDENMVKAIYDELDSELLYRICEIFRQVNKIEEIEERQKNLMAANRANS